MELNTLRMLYKAVAATNQTLNDDMKSKTEECQDLKSQLDQLRLDYDKELQKITSEDNRSKTDNV